MHYKYPLVLLHARAFSHLAEVLKLRYEKDILRIHVFRDCYFSKWSRSFTFRKL